MLIQIFGFKTIVYLHLSASVCMEVSEFLFSAWQVIDREDIFIAFKLSEKSSYIGQWVLLEMLNYLN